MGQSLSQSVERVRSISRWTTQSPQDDTGPNHLVPSASEIDNTLWAGNAMYFGPHFVLRTPPQPNRPTSQGQDMQRQTAPSQLINPLLNSTVDSNPLNPNILRDWEINRNPFVRCHSM
jgi:hypothetical protein